MKEFPPFRLDAADQSVWRGSQRLHLAPKAFDVLRYLVDRAGRLVTQTELLEALWPDTFVQPEVLKSQILDIRSALGDNPKEPHFIETVPRRGYRFVAAVKDSGEPERPTASPNRASSSPASPAMEDALDRSRIAVLPFVNMSSDPENEYFSDGLTEELINRLACVPSLQVVARTSAFRFKGQNEDIRRVGAKLNAGTVLEGSVRRAGGQLRVTAQLIDVRSGYHLFSRTYQREFKGVFELQDELAQAVVNEIVPKGAMTSRGGPAQSVGSDAYNAYLKGMFGISNRLTGVDQSIRHFQEAISLEPGYAAAWAGMAHAYFQRAWFYEVPAEKVMPLSKQAALKAVELDPHSALGFSSVGLAECVYDWQWASGEAHFEKAIELQPGLALMYPFFALTCLLPQRKLERACEVMERALLLDPFNPVCHAIATFVYGSAGRYDDGLRQYSIGKEVRPDFAPVENTLGNVQEWSGNLEGAISAFRKAASLASDISIIKGSLGHALAKKGETAEARQILQELMALPGQPHVDIARIYLGLGDAERTLDWLEIAVNHRNIHLLMVPSDSRYDWLRPNPRFQRILGLMGLESGEKRAGAFNSPSVRFVADEPGLR